VRVAPTGTAASRLVVSTTVAWWWTSFLLIALLSGATWIIEGAIVEEGNLQFLFATFVPLLALVVWLVIGAAIGATIRLRRSSPAADRVANVAVRATTVLGLLLWIGAFAVYLR
jgi:heme/copper-type cytochrome/quinol oxidase subunit 2